MNKTIPCKETKSLKPSRSFGRKKWTASLSAVLLICVAGCSQGDDYTQGEENEVTRQVTLKDSLGESYVVLNVTAADEVILDDYVTGLNMEPIYEGDFVESETEGAVSVDLSGEPSEHGPVASDIYIEEVSSLLAEGAVGYRIYGESLESQDDQETFRAGPVTHHYYSQMDCAQVRRTHWWYTVTGSISEKRVGETWWTLLAQATKSLSKGQAMSACGWGSTEVKASVTSKRTDAYDVCFY